MQYNCRQVFQLLVLYTSIVAVFDGPVTDMCKASAVE